MDELRTMAGQLLDELLKDDWPTIIGKLLDDVLVSALGVTPPLLTSTVVSFSLSTVRL